MKLFKPFLFLLLLFIVAIGYSQNEHVPKRKKRVIDPEKVAIGQTMTLSQRLGLVNEESQKVMAVYLKYHQQRAVIRATNEATADKKMLNQQLTAVEAQETEALKLVLSPEQNRKWAILKIKKTIKRRMNQIKRNWPAWVGGLSFGFLLLFFLIRKVKR